MTTQKVFSSRALNVNADTYVGEAGRLFYSQVPGTGTAPVLKYSDGVTPGGIPITGAGAGGSVTTATVNALIANSLTNYATQVYVNSQGFITTLSLSTYATQVYVNSRGFITTNIFTTTNISTFINDAHYIQNETGVNSVVGTANQVIVTDLGGRNIQLSTPQNLNTTATVQFGDLTVQNISILGTSTNLVSDVIQGYRLYLASSATNLSQVNGGGVQLGNTATGVHSIFWNADGYWDTDGDGIKTLTLEATTSTLGTLKVLNQARFGYVNQDLTLANAFIQVDSNNNNFSQIAIVNHNTGTSASADIVATNDTGNDSFGFIDMGINSSVFSTSSWTINGANDGYLYVAGGSLAIGTDQVGGEIKTFVGSTDNPTVVSVANASTITYSVDLMPSVDAQYLLGRPSQRWKGGYFGTGSVWIQDISLGSDAELTVDNGILFVNGISGLRVGNIQITTTGLTTNIGSQNITIGSPGDTGYLQVNRGIQYLNGSLQTVAWNSTATVQWDQITGAPNVTGYTGSAGTNGTNGYTGSFGTTGYTGSFGTTGYTGSAGTNGTNGYTGSFGTTGYTGSFGTTGYTGSAGTTGYTGSKGVADVYVSSITAGTGTQVSTSTGAVTIWVVPQTITTTATTTASNLTVDFSGPSFIAWQPSANGARTITLSGFTPGRKVEMFITPHTTNDIFTVSGVTTSQCSNGKNTFTMAGVGASQQSSFILQFYCTTNAIGGVWIYGNGTL